MDPGSRRGPPRVDPLRDLYRDAYRDPYRDTDRDPYRRSIHLDSPRDRSSRSLLDMQRKMDEDWDRFSRRGWGDDFDQICEDFFHLKPRPSRLSSLSRRDDNFSGSRESLDDDTVNNLFMETPGSASRTFQMSFNVKEYDPNNISVHIKDDTLLVEAKAELDRDGAKTIKEFNRKIKIPPEVDPEKLVSKLSGEGILTITALVPPRYSTLGHGNGSGQDAIPMPSPPVMTALQQPSYIRETERPASSYGGLPHQQPAADTKGPCPLAHSSGPPRSTSGADKLQPEEVLDTPMYSDTEQGRRMDLMLDIGALYQPEDLLVKVEGSSLLVEATHEEKAKGKTSRTSMSREFDIAEDIDPDTVQASLGTDGRLRISARVPGHKRE